MLKWRTLLSKEICDIRDSQRYVAPGSLWFTDAIDDLAPFIIMITVNRYTSTRIHGVR